MMYTVKLAVVLVQVGSKLWVNPSQVTALIVNDDGLLRVCVASDPLCRATDWPIEKVKAAIQERK
jgi:hypothetical protein